MNDERSTIEGTLETATERRQETHDEVPCLVLCWSREEPRRAGELGIVDREVLLGRGGARPDDGAPRIALGRQRPGAFTLTGRIESLRISRVQLRLRPSDDGGVEVESLGRCPLMLSGVEVPGGTALPGDTIHLKNELVFLVTTRPRELPRLPSWGDAMPFEFGERDPSGLAGESPAAWRLRDALAFAAASSEHVLVRGESGTGKELAARAIHDLSSRRKRPLVSRNAATVPEGLVDAELFGNVKNYPNPGTPEREGLVGEADGLTLFLDEIGELPVHMQAHLLRVLDRGGEYQRLGDSRPRRADLRVVAATNRPLDALKHDFLARLTLRLEIPSLDDRRDDVPLLARHLLLRAAETSEHVDRRFFAPSTGGGARHPRVSGALIDRLVRHSYRTHTRELEQLLWQALGESRGDHIELTEGVAAKLDAALPARAPAALTREALEACLTRHGNSVTRAARELGFKNRFALYRVMKKLGVSAVDEGAGD